MDVREIRREASHGPGDSITRTHAYLRDTLLASQGQCHSPKQPRRVYTVESQGAQMEIPSDSIELAIAGATSGPPTVPVLVRD